ncbi:MAG: UDP-N-acetylmuramoyl-L-alanyl-D-glutamate--2,6-diaminopimelate ligase [Hyphomicrobiales bacterium]|nr:UDP-N-acetylmuramoyl-L-alanyl-D-glutamate--2,6-diaminopimelate ligase [Hyphomicrobiales bacterium]
MIELGTLVSGLADLSKAAQSVQIREICADSRLVTQGCLFAALPGGNFDGGQFIPQALANGAAAILAGPEMGVDSCQVPVIRVKDTRLALALMASRFFPRQPDKMVAVTGTAGKTSVAEFIRQIWQGCGNNSASIGTTGVIAPGVGNYGNLTTPDPVTLHGILQDLSLKGVTHVSMEASSHGLDQKRLHGVRLDAAGFTNLGRDHLDYHSDMQDYLRAKMRLFNELLPRGSAAVIFADDPTSVEVARIARSSGHQVLGVGRKGDFLCLKRVEHERYHQIAEIVNGEKNCRIKFPLAGDFQISNALVSAGLAMASGVEFEDAMAQLEQLKGASGRLELVARNESGAPVYVDYAHKPDALENVLTSLRPFASRRLCLVFGCGGDRDPGKRAIMGEIGQRLADNVIVTDDNPRSENPSKIRQAILVGAPSAIEIPDRREAITRAVGELEEGDCLVVAGKGHETGQIVGDEVLEFSDHEEVRRAVGSE